MRILLTGRNGMVGYELERRLAALGEVLAFDRDALDLGNPDRIATCVREIRPQVIVNAAAYTAVDRAEDEPEVAMRVNAVGPGVLAEEAKRLGALLVHYSTDYVFDGTKAGAYTEDDAPNPLSAYGKSKLAGERAIEAAGGRHLILRTSWVYGARGKNFLLTMLRLARERPVLRVVADQIGAPTWCRDLAEATVRVLALPEVFDWGGLYHLTAAGETSWHGFACEILAARGLATPIETIGTRDYPTPARRPANSVLANGRFIRRFGGGIGPWRESLRMCLSDLPV